MARDVEKTLRSAIANAVNVADKNQKRRLDEDDLVVRAAYADQGPTQKRVRPAPMGRAYQVLRRTTHLTVCVAEQGDGTDGVVRSGGSPQPRRRASGPATRSTKSEPERGRQSKTQESK